MGFLLLKVARDDMSFVQTIGPRPLRLGGRLTFKGPPAVPPHEVNAMDAEAVLGRLHSMANPKNVEGMARFGISSAKTLGISVYDLRKVAKEIGRDHRLALSLWKSSVHEARLLAAFVDEPAKVTPAQMDAWARDFDSWDVCDQACTDLFHRTRFAHAKAVAWSRRPEEFVKRGGFALMAGIAWHDRDARDASFAPFLEAIRREATDDRNYVKKAVSWALRNIGKRNPALNRKAVATARAMQKIDSRAARWIASDAIRELTGEAVQKRLREKRPRRDL